MQINVQLYVYIFTYRGPKMYLDNLPTLKMYKNINEYKKPNDIYFMLKQQHLYQFWEKTLKDFTVLQ